MPKQTDLEAAMSYMLRVMGAPAWTEEHKFHPTRLWRFDFAWPEHLIAVEVEGGTWAKSRHTTGAGFEKDCIKYNAATLAGWRVFRFTSTMINDGRAYAFLEEVFGL